MWHGTGTWERRWKPGAKSFFLICSSLTNIGLLRISLGQTVKEPPSWRGPAEVLSFPRSHILAPCLPSEQVHPRGPLLQLPLAVPMAHTGVLCPGTATQHWGEPCRRQPRAPARGQRELLFLGFVSCSASMCFCRSMSMFQGKCLLIHNPLIA